MVFVRNFRTGQRWLSGQVVRVLGPVSFEVELTNGQIVSCHQDHIRKRTEMTDSSDGDFVTKQLASESLLEAPEVVVTENTSVAPSATLNPDTPKSRKVVLNWRTVLMEVVADTWNTSNHLV